MKKLTLIFISLISCASFNNSLAQESASFTVFFDYNKSNLTPTEENKLNTFVDSISINEITNISISAFCDDIGSNNYNLILSQKRANFVSLFLIRKEIEAELITSKIGNGEIQTIESESERAFNRRAKIIIQYVKIRSATEADNDIITINNNYKPQEKTIIINDLKVGDKITLDDILFIGGRHALLSESYASLKALVKALKKHENYSIVILGHICCTKPGRDGRDTDTGLINLSTARAETIYDYLIDNGIDANRLEYKGMKGDFPTGLGDKFDRRVEIEISAIN